MELEKKYNTSIPTIPLAITTAPELSENVPSESGMGNGGGSPDYT